MSWHHRLQVSSRSRLITNPLSLSVLLGGASFFSLTRSPRSCRLYFTSDLRSLSSGLIIPECPLGKMTAHCGREVKAVSENKKNWMVKFKVTMFWENLWRDACTIVHRCNLMEKKLFQSWDNIIYEDRSEVNLTVPLSESIS